MGPSPLKKPEGEAARAVTAVRAAALRLLARREHSIQELTEKLRARGFETEPVAEVVAALAARNLVSDARFLQEFVASRSRRGAGPAKIREELRSRGVDPASMEAELAGRSGEWLAKAENARRKRFGAELPRDYQERARQARFLQQRGFTADQIRQVMKGDLDNL